MGNHTIIVCEYGWILVGEAMESDKGIELQNASVVRKWSNGRGIGALAKKEHKDEYTLDAIGGVVINKAKVLFEIPCEW